MLTTEKCPCGKDSSYAMCCAPYHNGSEHPRTAEILMRSRYSAFAKEKTEYLLKTHHPTTIYTVDFSDLVAFCKRVRFVQLKVIKSRQGRETDNIATVKFKAYFMDNGEKSCIAEHSTFEKINGVWYYKSAI